MRKAACVSGRYWNLSGLFLCLHLTCYFPNASVFGAANINLTRCCSQFGWTNEATSSAMGYCILLVRFVSILCTSSLSMHTTEDDSIHMCQLYSLPHAQESPPRSFSKSCDTQLGCTGSKGPRLCSAFCIAICPCYVLCIGM